MKNLSLSALAGLFRASLDRADILGKNGETLKKIGSAARYELEKFLNGKVNIKIWVKVRKEWRDNQNLLKELGYKKTK